MDSIQSSERLPEVTRPLCIDSDNEKYSIETTKAILTNKTLDMEMRNKMGWEKN